MPAYATPRRRFNWHRVPSSWAGRLTRPMLAVLADAYAAGGRYEEAVAAGEKAEVLAIDATPELREFISERLSLYRAGRPYVAP